MEVHAKSMALELEHRKKDSDIYWGMDGVKYDGPEQQATVA
jgi:hypothetical protein